MPKVTTLQSIEDAVVKTMKEADIKDKKTEVLFSLGPPERQRFLIAYGIGVIYPYGGEDEDTPVVYIELLPDPESVSNLLAGIFGGDDETEQ